MYSYKQGDGADHIASAVQHPREHTKLPRAKGTQTELGSAAEEAPPPIAARILKVHSCYVPIPPYRGVEERAETPLF
jgi:hypothetical protein